MDPIDPTRADITKGAAEAVHLLKLWCLMLSVMLLISIVLGSVGVYVASRTTSEVSSLAVKTCRVQSTSLPAHNYLTGAIDDLYRVLTIPPTKAPLESQKRLPAKYRDNELKIVKQLDNNAFNYAWIESHLPTSRTC